MDSKKKKKKKKKKPKPNIRIHRFIKAKTEIRNKANLKKTTSSVINDND